LLRAGALASLMVPCDTPLLGTRPVIRVERLVNGSTGDPALYLDFHGAANAILCDAGENEALARADLADLTAVLLTHHHPDHASGLARIVRYLADQDREVTLVGPVGTIDRVEHQLRAITHLDFPFMKLVLAVIEIDWGAIAWARARFACRNGFTREQLPPGRPPKDGVVLRTAEARVRCAPASHSVPCLAYAIDLVPGWYVDPAKATTNPLRPGPWVGQVLAAARLSVHERPAHIQVDGGTYPLAELLARYFVRQARRATIAFVTDTRREAATWPGLVALAQGADRLYCDAYYMARDAKAAMRHGHLTAQHAGELANEAGAKRLWLMHMGPRYHGRYDEWLAEARAVFPDTTADLPPHPRREHEPRDD